MEGQQILIGGVQHRNAGCQSLDFDPAPRFVYAEHTTTHDGEQASRQLEMTAASAD